MHDIAVCHRRVWRPSQAAVQGMVCSDSETGYMSALRAAAFAMGLASTLALLGVISTYVGRAYGQIGSGLPIGAH